MVDSISQVPEFLLQPYNVRTYTLCGLLWLSCNTALHSL